MPECSLVHLIPGTEDETPDVVELVTDEQFAQEKQEWRKRQLKSLYRTKLHPTLLPEDKEQLIKVLAEHHSIFSLEEGERGETSLAEFFYQYW